MFKRFSALGIVGGAALLWNLLIPVLQQQHPEWFSYPWVLDVVALTVFICFIPLPVQLIIWFYGVIHKSFGEKLRMAWALVLLVGALCGTVLAAGGYWIFLTAAKRQSGTAELSFSAMATNIGYKENTEIDCGR